MQYNNLMINELYFLNDYEPNNLLLFINKSNTSSDIFAKIAKSRGLRWPQLSLSIFSQILIQENTNIRHYRVRWIIYDLKNPQNE